MNPYYATGFLTALFFWVWPAFLYRSLDAHWMIIVFFSVLLFLGGGRAATEFHIRVIAPEDPPKGRSSRIVVTCFAIVAAGLLTRIIYNAYAGS